MAEVRRFGMPALELPINASPALVFQLIAAVGQGHDAAHARVLERPSPERAIVEFTTTVFGRQVRTLEEVGFHAPDRITYRLIRGPLPAVDEEFLVQPSGDGSLLRYRGTISAAPAVGADDHRPVGGAEDLPQGRVVEHAPDQAGRRGAPAEESGLSRRKTRGNPL